MGAQLSLSLADALGSSAKKHAPPQTVLVPPLFERDLKARGRFAASSYDYLPPRKALKWLLTDYLQGPGVNGKLALCPAADQRLTVKGQVGSRGGAMTLRWQPLGPAISHTFLELKANPRVLGDVALKACVLHAASGVGFFAVLPLAKRITGKCALLGVRYASPSASAGVIVSPRDGGLQQAWLAGRTQGCTFGLQVCPGVPLSALLNPNISSEAAGQHLGSTSSDNATAGGSGSRATQALAAGGPEAWEWLRQHTSMSLSYTPPAVSKAGAAASGEAAERGGPFTVGVEVVQGASLAFSFLQRMAPARKVVNPMEEGTVVGIVNYIDIGLLLVTPISPPQEGKGAASASLAAGALGVKAGTPAAKHDAYAFDASKLGVSLGASWQVNKNWLVKGRVGTDGGAAALGARLWGSGISAAVTASAHLSYASLQPRYGFTLQVENHGDLMYRREGLDGSTGGPSGRAVLQRHEASGQELANAQGIGKTVLRSPSGELLAGLGVLGPQASEISRLM